MRSAFLAQISDRRRELSLGVCSDVPHALALRAVNRC